MPPISTGLDLQASLARIRAAAAAIGPYVRRTPTVYSYTFSESSGNEVWLKLENLQRTGAFKARGALNKLLSLEPEARARGLIAASAGNHAQGVALAARMLGNEATIVMPLSTALVKVQRTEGYGAKVVLHGANYDEAQAHALELVRERGMTLIHPFDDLAVIEGQGTCGLEILEDLPRVDAILVPIGGGGLIAGIALAVKALAPGTRVIGVQAAGAAPMVASFHSGVKQRVERPSTIAEGIRVGFVGDNTFEIIRQVVDECVTVDDDEIADAVVQTMEKSKMVCEAAGAAGIAALIARKVRLSGTVCAVLSGGNIDLNLLARIIENGLAHAGRTHLLRLRLPDQPGQLNAVLALLAERKANVLEVQHYRAGWRVPLGFVEVEILVETRLARQGHELEQVLAERGFTLS